MKNIKNAALALWLALFCLSLAATDEKAVIEKTIRANIGWALTKDRPLAESTMIHDERLFIFNPDSESTVGWEHFVKNFDFWMDPRFRATGLDIRDLRIAISPIRMGRQAGRLEGYALDRGAGKAGGQMAHRADALLLRFRQGCSRDKGQAASSADQKGIIL
jgi:hypothetical protein